MHGFDRYLIILRLTKRSKEYGADEVINYGKYDLTDRDQVKQFRAEISKATKSHSEKSKSYKNNFWSSEIVLIIRITFKDSYKISDWLFFDSKKLSN